MSWFDRTRAQTGPSVTNPGQGGPEQVRTRTLSPSTPPAATTQTTPAANPEIIYDDQGVPYANTGKAHLNQIIDAYVQFVGRFPTQEELKGFGGTWTLRDATAAVTRIQNSQEARRYQADVIAGRRTPFNGSTSTTAGNGDPMDSATIRASLNAAAKKLGRTITEEDLAYWEDKIRGTGGLNDWWLDRMSHESDGVGSVGVEGGGGGADELTAPWTEQFSYDKFTAPDPSKVAEDPLFKFDFKQGMQALQRSASSRGTLLTGGTLKDLEQFGQDLASTTYDKQYGRAANEWSTGYNKALGEYEQRYNIFEGNQGKKFNRLSALAGLGQSEINALNSQGMGYAGLYGNTATQGAGRQGDYLTGIGNSQAAAGVAGGNALAGAIAGSGNNFLAAYLRNSRYGKPQ